MTLKNKFIIEPFIAAIEESISDISESVTKIPLHINDYVAIYNDKCIFESYRGDKLECITEADTNIFAKIGNKVKALIQKFIAFIQKIFGGVEEKINENNTNVDRIEAAMAKNPKIRTQIVEGLESGALKVKDLEYLNSNGKTIIEDFVNGKTDEKTLSSKIEDLCDTVDKKTKPISKVIGTVTTVVGLIGATVAIGTTMSKISSANKQNASYLEQIYTAYAKTRATPKQVFDKNKTKEVEKEITDPNGNIKKIKENVPDPGYKDAVDDSGKLQYNSRLAALANAIGAIIGKQTSICKEHGVIFNKISSIVDKVADKVSKSSPDEAAKTYADKLLQKDAQRKRESEINKNLKINEENRKADKTDKL